MSEQAKLELKIVVTANPRLTRPVDAERIPIDGRLDDVGVVVSSRQKFDSRRRSNRVPLIDQRPHRLGIHGSHSGCLVVHPPRRASRLALAPSVGAQM